MKTYDLSGATLYDPDADARNGPVCMGQAIDYREMSVAIPPYAYGRRIRVVNVKPDGVTVSKRDLDVRTLVNCIGAPPYMTVTGTAFSGQECIIVHGSDGQLIFGEGFKSISRKSVRRMRKTVGADGRLEVRI